MSFLVFAPAASVVHAAPASPTVFLTLAPALLLLIMMLRCCGAIEI
jgi:hypothetical protein